MPAEREPGPGDGKRPPMEQRQLFPVPSPLSPVPLVLLGLRIDVDTHDGMKRGVPRLLDILRATGVTGTFYLSMGPDRSGRAIFNVFRPGFVDKMRRNRAGGVYGLRTVLSGTLLPARPVATAFPEVALRIVADGHEVGVHAWDHRTWQDRLPRFSRERVAGELDKARAAFVELYGREPLTFAAPAWLSTGLSLLHQETYDLEYASDCRGSEPFRPRVGGDALRTPQVPSTLPTLDEALGSTHGDASAYFSSILEDCRRQPWPVLTIHAELEGGPFSDAFATFLARAARTGVAVVPLKELLAARLASGAPLPVCEVTHKPVPGRHGVLATQLADARDGAQARG